MTIPKANENRIVHNHEEIEIFGLKFSLSFLRCFGAEFSILHISFTPIALPRQSDCFDQNLAKYCAATLKTVRFVQKPSFKIENFSNTFGNVRDVFIGDLDLSENLALIAHLFPNLRQLVLYDFTMDAGCAVPFPHLHDLGVSNWKNIRKTNLLDLLHANPQLTECQLNVVNEHESLTLATISELIAPHSSLTKFWIIPNNSLIVSTLELWHFANRHLLLVDLDLARYVIEVDDVIAFLGQMQSLKRFRFKLIDRAQYRLLRHAVRPEWQYKRHFDRRDPTAVLNNVVLLSR